MSRHKQGVEGRSSASKWRHASSKLNSASLLSTHICLPFKSLCIVFFDSFRKSQVHLPGYVHPTLYISALQQLQHRVEIMCLHVQQPKLYQLATLFHFFNSTTSLSVEKPCQFVNVPLKQTLSASDFISIFTSLQSKPTLPVTQTGISLQPVAPITRFYHHCLYFIKQFYWSIKSTNEITSLLS